MARQHRSPKRNGTLPAWVKEEENPCLVSVAEDAYTARRLAIEDYRADAYTACKQLLRAGNKSLRVLADPTAAVRKRCAEGDRAARKFWEAKVCARRMG